jgi:hypothetical protein
VLVCPADIWRRLPVGALGPQGMQGALALSCGAGALCQRRVERTRAS